MKSNFPSLPSTPFNNVKKGETRFPSGCALLHGSHNTTYVPSDIEIIFFV